MATAYGWGGLPGNEVSNLNMQSNLTSNAYTLIVKAVPGDAFWSFSIDNQDGSIIIHWAVHAHNDHFLPISPGWNYGVRIYQPAAVTASGLTFGQLIEAN
jgi:hypothetical protein